MCVEYEEWSMLYIDTEEVVELIMAVLYGDDSTEELDFNDVED